MFKFENILSMLSMCKCGVGGGGALPYQIECAHECGCVKIVFFTLKNCKFAYLWYT